MNDVRLLKVGRHFRVSPKTKFIVGRNKEENEKLTSLAGEEDFLLQPAKVKGPIGIGRGNFKKEHFCTASSIIARYSDKGQDPEIEVLYEKVPGGRSDSIRALSMTEEALKALRI